jgi:hypothetical protein
VAQAYPSEMRVSVLDRLRVRIVTRDDRIPSGESLLFGIGADQMRFVLASLPQIRFCLFYFVLVSHAEPEAIIVNMLAWRHAASPEKLTALRVASKAAKAARGSPRRGGRGGGRRY